MNKDNTNDDGTMKKQTTNTITPKKKKDTPTTIIGKNGSVVNTDGTGRILLKTSQTITPAKGQKKEKDETPFKKKRQKTIRKS